MFNCCDVKKDGRITVEEFLEFFGGYELHWSVQVPSNYPDSNKAVGCLLISSKKAIFSIA